MLRCGSQKPPRLRRLVLHPLPREIDMHHGDMHHGDTHHGNMKRRQFLKHGGGLVLSALPLSALPLSALPLSALPLSALPQSALLRQDWSSFSRCEHYASFIEGVARMRAVTDSADPRSWRYWSRLYAQGAALGRPYFLAWNRSLLARFERQLQAVAGNSQLTLPYWDCFRDPELPLEFTPPANWNALYAPRAGDNVCAALSLAAFAPQITNMQRGLPDAFEVILESIPHNTVHNLLGHAMAGMSAPEDPIFWLFQANLDRLWTAWMHAAGKKAPASGTPYWDAATVDGLASPMPLPADSPQYAQASLPGALPTPAPALSLPKGSIAGRLPVSALSLEEGRLGSMGSMGSMDILRLPNAGMRFIDARHLVLVSARRIVLAEASSTLELPLTAAASALLRELLWPSGAASAYRGARIVCDDLQLLGQGADGGYYYALYLNLPAAIDAAGAHARHLLGTIGAFEIAAARQRMARGLAASVRVDFAAGAVLQRVMRPPCAGVALSFCRINANGATPSGGVVAIGEVRLELSTVADV
jgi:tyrosinase